MRTTVTLDPDVAQKLRDLAHRKRLSFKVVLNEAIRRGLTVQEKLDGEAAPFVVRPVAAGFRPGLDLGRLNELVDQFEAEDFQREARRET